MSVLEKNLGPIEALSIGVGSMIGAGIFVLSGIAAQAAGPGAALSFAIAGGIVLLTALSFVELATAMPRAGGPYVYVKEAFGPSGGFLVGWSLWIGLALATGFYTVGFAQYASFLLPALPTQTIAWMLCFLLVGINLFGSKGSGRLQTALVLLLVGILLLYVFLGLRRVDPTLHTPFFPYGWEPVFRTSTTVFVSFLGFELIATAAEEIRNPKRVLPLATLASVLFVTFVYVLVLFVATGIMSHFDLGETPTPIADTARHIAGPGGAAAIILAGLLATLSSANASLLASSRVAWAMARDRLLPPFLGMVHPRFAVPHLSLAVTGVIILFAVNPRNVRWLAEAAGFLHLYPFVIVNVALLRLRRETGFRPSFRIPLGPAVPIGGALATALLLFKVEPRGILWGAALLLPGLAYHFARGFVGEIRWRRLIPWG